MSPARRKNLSDEGGFVDFGETAPRLADPAVDALLSQSERRQGEARLSQKERERKRKEREKMRQRRAGHTTYDIPVALRKRMAELSEREGVPASQLAALALLRFLGDLQAGALTLSEHKVPSRSPRYDYNLILPLEVLEPARKGKKQG